MQILIRCKFKEPVSEVFQFNYFSSIISKTESLQTKRVVEITVKSRYNAMDFLQNTYTRQSYLHSSPASVRYGLCEAIDFYLLVSVLFLYLILDYIIIDSIYRVEYNTVLNTMGWEKAKSLFRLRTHIRHPIHTLYGRAMFFLSSLEKRSHQISRVLCRHNETWGPSQYKDTRLGIPMLKIRRSRDRLIFNMEIPYLERRSLYWTGPAVLHQHPSFWQPSSKKGKQKFNLISDII